jgi:hypothetical protein
MHDDAAIIGDRRRGGLVDDRAELPGLIAIELIV